MLGHNPSKKTTVVVQQSNVSNQTVNISNESELLSVLKQYEDEGNTSVEWILLEPSSDSSIKYITHGSGYFAGAPPDSLVKLIDDKKVQYLLVSMKSGVRQLSLFTWIGADADSNSVKLSDQQKMKLHSYLSSKLHHGNTLLSGELRG